jgi:chromosome segregation ATPase
MSSGKRIVRRSVSRTGDASQKPQSTAHDRIAKRPSKVVSRKRSENYRKSSHNFSDNDSESEELFRYSPVVKRDNFQRRDYGDPEFYETLQYALNSINTDENYGDESNSSEDTTDHENEKKYVRKNLNRLNKHFDNAISEQNRYLNEVSIIKQRQLQIENLDAYENGVAANESTKKLEHELLKTQKELEWVKSAVMNNSIVAQNQSAEKTLLVLEKKLQQEYEIQQQQQRQIQQFQERIEQLQKLNDQQAQQFETERTTLTEQLQVLHNEVDHKDSEMVNLCSLHEQVLKELTDMREREEAREQHEKEVIDKTKELQHQNKKQSEQLLAIRQKLNDKSTEYKQLGKATKELKSQDQEIRKEKAEIEKTHSNLQKRHSELIAQCKELKQCARSMEGELEQTHQEQEKRNAVWAKERSDLKRAIEVGERRFSELEVELTRERGHHNKLSEERSSLTREIIDLKQNIKELQNDMERVQRERDIRLAAADEVFNTKVKEVLDREIKQKEANRDMQRRLEEAELQNNELQARLVDSSRSQKEEIERKWNSEKHSLVKTIEREKEVRTRIEQKSKNRY